MILPGMNGRFFPANHRPALQESEFAAGAGFRSLQFQGWETGLSEADLGASFAEVARGLRLNRLTPVMEMVVRVDLSGKTAVGNTPLDVLHANLPAILEIGGLPQSGGYGRDTDGALQDSLNRMRITP